MLSRLIAILCNGRSGWLGLVMLAACYNPNRLDSPDNHSVIYKDIVVFGHVMWQYQRVFFLNIITDITWPIINDLT